MMSVFTQHLENEHRVIERGLDLLDLFSIKLRAGYDVDFLELNTLVFVLRKLVEDAHQRKEELLFEALAKHESFDVTREVHEAGRFALMRIGLEAGRFDASPSREVLAKRIQDYVDLMRQHLERTDPHLFEMANRLISAEAQLTLLKCALEMDDASGGSAERWVLPVLDNVALSLENTLMKKRVEHA